MAWMTMRDYSRLYPWPQLKTLRWLTHKIEKEMGKTAPYVHRWGRKVMVDPDLFQSWIVTEEAQQVRMNWIAKDREIKREKREAKKRDASCVPSVK